MPSSGSCARRRRPTRAEAIPVLGASGENPGNRNFRFDVQAGQHATPVHGAWDEILVDSVAHQETRSPDGESTLDDPTSSTFLGHLSRVAPSLRWLRAALAGTFDVVLAKSLERFSRDQEDTLLACSSG
jgi:hypothetical protein